MGKPYYNPPYYREQPKCPECEHAPHEGRCTEVIPDPIDYDNGQHRQCICQFDENQEGA